MCACIDKILIPLPDDIYGSRDDAHRCSAAQRIYIYILILYVYGYCEETAEGCWGKYGNEWRKLQLRNLCMSTSGRYLGTMYLKTHSISFSSISYYKFILKIGYKTYQTIVKNHRIVFKNHMLFPSDYILIFLLNSMMSVYRITRSRFIMRFWFSKKVLIISIFTLLKAKESNDINTSHEYYRIVLFLTPRSLSLRAIIFPAHLYKLVPKKKKPRAKKCALSNWLLFREH